MKKFNPKTVRACIDRYPDRPDDVKEAARIAVAENPANAPLIVPGVDLFPLELALLTGVKWAADKILGIVFMDGTEAQKAEVRRQAEVWLPFVSLRFNWKSPPGLADIRISFKQVGAWSYLGTDCLTIDRGAPTMNFGFLQPGTATHEFGHALGMIHEHQSPGAGVIPWVASRVYAYYGGPPNNWTRQQVDQNILSHYAVERTQFTEWDRASIMEYPVDVQLVSDPSFAVGWNTELSPKDKEFVGRVYPRVAVPPVPPVPPAGPRRVVTVSFPRDSTGSIVVDGTSV